MSIIRADSIKNRAGTGAPDFRQMASQSLVLLHLQF